MLNSQGHAREEMVQTSPPSGPQGLQQNRTAEHGHDTQQIYFLVNKKQGHVFKILQLHLDRNKDTRLRQFTQ